MSTKNNPAETIKTVAIIAGSALALYLGYKIYQGIKFTIEKGGEIIDGVANGLGVGPESAKTEKAVEKIKSTPPTESAFSPKYLQNLMKKGGNYSILTQASVNNLINSMKGADSIFSKIVGSGLATNVPALKAAAFANDPRQKLYAQMISYFKHKTQVSYFADKWEKATGKRFIDSLTKTFVGNELNPAYEEFYRSLLSHIEKLPQ